MQPLKIRTWLDGHSPALQAVSALTPGQSEEVVNAVTSLHRRSGCDTTSWSSAARKQHGVPRIHLMDLVALTQEDRAAGDEMELCAAFLGSEPKAEGRRKLNPPIFDASQAHSHQKFIQRIE